MTDVHALSGAYAIDALDDAERRQFDDHLAACAECRAEVAGLREAGAALSATTEAQPPSALRERVLHDIALVRPLPPKVASLAAHRRRRLAPLLSAAAAVAVIGVGTVTVWQSVNDQDATAPSAQTQPSTLPTVSPSAPLTAAERVIAARDAETHKTQVDGGGSLTAVRSHDLGQAVVVAQGLNPLSEDEVYELWLRLDGAMVPAGLMTGTDGAVVLRGDSTNAEAVGVTVEQAGGSPQGVPTTQPIAYFPLEQV